MVQMVVDELSLSRVPLTRHHYRLTIRMGEHVWERWTNDHVGHLMSVCSDLWKSIALTAGLKVTETRTPILDGAIALSEMGVTPSLVVGERWTLRMASGPYRYVAGMSETLESVMLAFMGAMKFFSFKYGYTTLDPEVVRNRTQAVRDGLVTQEDHVRRAKPGRNGHR